MKRAVRFGVLLLSPLLLLSCGGGVGSAVNPTSSNLTAQPCNPQQDTTCHTLTAGGVSRTYILHVPTNFQANSSALLIVMHGRGGNGSGMEIGTGLSAKADQVGFAVAYPDGLMNLGFSDWAIFFNDYTDDIGFLRALIASLQSSLHPDPKRIYLTGFSSGARMSQRAGVQLSDLVAAIGPVEGSLFVGTQTVPNAIAPVSVVIIQGDASGDPSSSFCGPPPANNTSQEITFNYWVSSQANSCASISTAAPLCDAQGNVTAVSEKHATSCSANSTVQFYKLIGGQHTWYTSPMNVPGQIPFNPALTPATGLTTNDILWNFFAAHPKP